MKPWLQRLGLLALGLVLVTAAPGREEMLPLTETRSISITVPDGFTYQAGVNARGRLGITLVHDRERINLSVTFEPDPEGEFRAERSRKEKMHAEFSSYVDGSIEKAMQFTELEPKVGAATYCVFTDPKLQGKPASEYPEGEYLQLTAGVKAWPGIVASFTIFSNDTSSEAYQALMKVLRESVHEKPAPLL